ncbi:RagB/SusD family nutrient uptake outer membrane protein [Chitinophaga horti]|uniref:RagB/SusD family nutrient uptake outer membrane protein n=1 Tax=Chitinophaga horti TaxID=2920382 RepID=A0ABY6IV56_9BACT|nr:RagB/SusD family nutrient uptake outer membrane protein [Chitinophaga horti]UYQ91257.1 RagB/SusD family nutrient uptake outer membrane protein [Chitinophaga horti]
MKRLNSIISGVAVITALATFTAGCRKDLLNQKPTGELDAGAFWKTENDAVIALQGAYADIRPVFDRDYYFDGMGDFVRVRGTSALSGNLQKGDAYHNGNYAPGGGNPQSGGSFDKMYRYLYGGVNRANYVIDNVNRMLTTAAPTSVAGLERIVGEARLLRGMLYFRLITLWGDVPYIGKTVFADSEVSKLARTPIAQVKDSIMADFTYAFEKLPIKATEFGRASKPAALAFRGKLQLYWACWNGFGWPELAGFTPSPAAAEEAYKAAAEDFRKVINDYGLTLWRNGDPGLCDPPGKADNLPNYYYLFTPQANQGNTEMIMVFTHGGTGTNQGEELMRDVAGRSHESSQCWVSPRYEIADRYQLIATGDYAPKLVPTDPSVAGARTAVNSAINPQSYAGRDYRMKASIMWDYEMSVGMAALKSTGWVPFLYKTWTQPITIGGVTYNPYNTDGTNSGYVFRKYLRNYAGQGRSDGDYAFPVMRLADVFLMYAEATNAVSGPQADAIDLLNRIRRRGNLPALAPAKTANKEAFLEAIEQERIIELLAEGHRYFDIRRWRKLEQIWGAPGSAGVWMRDTHGGQVQQFYQNQPERNYQQFYIWRIPTGERDRNPNLTQNTPWL